MTWHVNNSMSSHVLNTCIYFRHSISKQVFFYIFYFHFQVFWLGDTMTMMETVTWVLMMAPLWRMPWVKREDFKMNWLMLWEFWVSNTQLSIQCWKGENTLKSEKCWRNIWKVEGHFEAHTFNAICVNQYFFEATKYNLRSSKWKAFEVEIKG